MQTSPPISEQQLQQRAQAIAGLTVGELAQQCNIEMATDLRTHKGWLGDLLEIALGASAGSEAWPDFPELGIELKTLPVDRNGKPQESTFVTSIPLLEIRKQTWQTSTVRNKLAHVLWVPIESNPELKLSERHIGAPLLWKMDSGSERVLRSDWQELTEMICLGQLEKISAKQGEALQIRPKGANSKSLCWAINSEGEKALTLPRGFYLRAKFTQALMQKFYRV